MSDINVIQRKSMSYELVLDAIIERGIAAASHDYTQPHDANKLHGSIAGFEACRDKQPIALSALLNEARKSSRRALEEGEATYWQARCYEAEIEWVCNCVSVLLQQNGAPIIVPPTARALLCIAQIVGVNAPD